MLQWLDVYCVSRVGRVLVCMLLWPLRSEVTRAPAGKLVMRGPGARLLCAVVLYRV